MIIDIDNKRAILQNNFQTESKSSAKAHEKASLAATGETREPPSPAPRDTPEKPRGGSKTKRGPKTERGKRAVSRNAIKHGIMSPHPVIIESMETIEDWEEFESAIVESWETVGKYEQEMAERIAFLLWRLRRSRHHETAVLNHQVQGTAEDLYTAAAYLAGRDADVPDPDPARVNAYRQLRIIPSDMSIDRIMRYETHVHRLLVSTIHELEARQAGRRGERVTLGRFDFNSVPNPDPPRSASAQLSGLLADDK